MKKLLILLLLPLSLFGQTLPFPIGNKTLNQYCAAGYVKTNITTDSIGFVTDRNWFSFNKYVKQGKDTLSTRSYARSIVPSASNFVTIANAQTVTGLKTFGGGLKTDTISNEAGELFITDESDGSSETRYIYNSVGSPLIRSLYLSGSNTYAANFYDAIGTNPILTTSVGTTTASTQLFGYDNNKILHSNWVSVGGNNYLDYYGTGGNKMIRYTPTSTIFGRGDTILFSHDETTVLYNGINNENFATITNNNTLIKNPFTSYDAISLGESLNSFSYVNGSVAFELNGNGMNILDESGGTAMQISKEQKVLRLVSTVTGNDAVVIDSTTNFYNTTSGIKAYELKNDSILFRQPTNLGAYGEIYFSDASTLQSIPTGTTYTKITPFTTNGVSYKCVNDATNDKITITEAGIYRVDGSFSSYSGTANITLRTAVFLDGVEQSNIHTIRKFGNASDISTGSFSGFITVTSVPVDIDVRCRHDNGGSVNLTPVYGNLNLNKAH